MSITRINEFKSTENKDEELFEFLKSLIPYISSSEGCLSCEVLQNLDDRSNFVVLEKWESIEHHKQSIENFPKEDMQSAMSLFGAPPKGGYFWNCTSVYFSRQTCVFHYWPRLFFHMCSLITPSKSFLTSRCSFTRLFRSSSSSFKS